VPGTIFAAMTPARSIVSVCLTNHSTARQRNTQIDRLAGNILQVVLAGKLSITITPAMAFGKRVTDTSVCRKGEERSTLTINLFWHILSFAL
jgi:hypothetical protein